MSCCSGLQHLLSVSATASSHLPGLCLLLCTESLLQALVSVSVIGTQDSLTDEQLTAAVLKELSAWFGPDQTATWSHLKTYRCGLLLAGCAWHGQAFVVKPAIAASYRQDILQGLASSPLHLVDTSLVLQASVDQPS